MSDLFAVTSPFAMVVLIVAIVTKGNSTRSRADEMIIGSMQSQIDKLTDRVGVLEKLVTDDDRRLSREIDQLRGRERTSI
jgi:hypothetical protein